MTDLHHVPSEPSELVLHFRNQRPISAADLGELFSALAKDYGQINEGRKLVVAKLESGTLLVHLQDLYNVIAPYAKHGLEAVNAANSLKKFSEVIRGMVFKAKEHPVQTVPLLEKQSPGIRSVEKIAQVVLNAGGEVEYEHRTADGEEIKFRITSPEAARIRAQQKRLRGRRKGKTRLLDPDQIADRLAGTDASAVTAVIRAFASSLRDAGMGHVLEKVATRLDARGLHSLATAVRVASREDEIPF
jgi:hypothetical protein